MINIPFALTGAFAGLYLFQVPVGVTLMIYEMGKGSMTDVLDAQAASLEAEATYAQALVGHAVAVAELRLATGEQE